MANLILPLPTAIAEASAELTRAAVMAGDTKRQIALNKASYDLLVLLPVIVIVPGGFLVPSTSRAGLVHRVDTVNGCDCEAGRGGRLCRHKTALEIIEVAQTRTMPALSSTDRAEKLRAAEQATRELCECF
ncbi:hypothetical protein [Kouleothrix sp.]|uniref:hypothetical protein n=1 Tax=Kouleothrix sp. TaxID=2779161 RepID=UPI003919E4D3